jgi:hypothetical protein
VRALLLLCLVACTPQDDPPAFGFLGPVENVFQGGSTIGLWEVRTPSPLTYKFGEGQATAREFSLEFRLDPPDEALEDSEFGVGFVAMLPGLATAPEGAVDPNMINQIGGSTDTAVIFKKPGATGPAWLADFRDGFSCAICLREEQPDGFAPVDCTFVTVEPGFTNRCTW